MSEPAPNQQRAMGKRGFHRAPALGYVGRELHIQYFDDVYPVKVEAVGYAALYDPENTKPRS